MNYYGFASAKPENLAKVAATKNAEGLLDFPAKMRRDSFGALVRYKWLAEVRHETEKNYRGEGKLLGYKLTAEGEKVLASHKEVAENPFVGGHGAKAQETFKLLGTKHSDWFHPAIKWVRETRNMPFEQFKTCPVCEGLKYVQFDAEGKVIPPPAAAAKGSYDYKAEQARHDYAWKARNAKSTHGVYAWNGNCPKCVVRGRRGAASCEGRVFSHIEWKPVEMMVGYIVWPKGVKHGQSRFGHGGNSLTQCEICGKGINKSGRVPVAHDKGGKALSMWVGQDCAQKFVKVAAFKPSKDQMKGVEYYTLDDNYVAEGEVK